jgi:hypothetical protein
LKTSFSPSGPQEASKALEFLQAKFLTQNENKNKQIYTHLTCATDTEQINVVFNAVMDIVLHQMLEQVGMGF